MKSIFGEYSPSSYFPKDTLNFRRNQQVPNRCGRTGEEKGKESAEKKEETEKEPKEDKDYSLESNREGFGWRWLTMESKKESSGISSSLIISREDYI